MADRLLVLVLHEHTHAPAAFWNRPGNWALMSLKWGQLNTQWSSSPTAVCIANGASAKVAREGWPGKMDTPFNIFVSSQANAA